jgi:hypothetical protein
LLSIPALFAARCLLILFQPCSARDKILTYAAAVDQAAQDLPARLVATTLICAGFVGGAHTLYAIYLNRRGAG